MAFNSPRDKRCGCKGIRTCLICENIEDICLKAASEKKMILKYCDMCKRAWENGQHPDHSGRSIEFPGIFLQNEFIDESEEAKFCQEIDKTQYADSQSGRRKQDYGPKVNFKKKKVKYEKFTGLPEYSEILYKRFKSIPLVADFIPVELCNLEYIPERGSAIDPHFDDFWLWGERLVTVNLSSETILYFINDDIPDIEVHVSMPARCLIVVYGEARNKWKHGIHRSDITDRRIAMTFRELSEEFEDGGKNSDVGEKLKDIALTFQGFAVGVKPES